MSATHLAKKLNELAPIQSSKQDQSPEQIGSVVAVIGATGLVGQELIKLLKQRNFPLKELRLASSKEPPLDFAGVDLAFFCVGAAVSRALIPKAHRQGTLCIDSSSAFRMDPDVPLVIPEINKEALHHHKGIIASPNCTTTLMLLALAPLHRLWPIQQVICSTYQAISGAGISALRKLESSPFFHATLHESPLNTAQYNEEEEKMHWESRKILQDGKLEVTATCVRVPVRRTHSLALHCIFDQEIDLEQAQEALKQAKGIYYVDPPPTTREAEEKEAVFCGRLRRSRSNPRALELWVVGDQLLKGAALNSVHIAEELR